MEAQESISPLLIRREIQQVIALGYHIQEQEEKDRARSPASSLPVTHSIHNPSSKALSRSPDGFCKADKKHNLYTYTRAREVSKTGAAFGQDWLKKATQIPIFVSFVASLEALLQH